MTYSGNSEDSITNFRVLRGLAFATSVFGIIMLTSCGDSDEDNTDVAANQDECISTALESDFVVDVPLSGPGVDPNSGELIIPASGPVVAATTYLRLKNTEAGLQRFDELSGPVVQDLQQRFGSGLLAFSFASSTLCNVRRTLTIWQSEADMMGFVTGDAHLDAIRNVGDISRGGSITQTFQVTGSVEVDWSNVASTFATHNGPIY